MRSCGSRLTGALLLAGLAAGGWAPVPLAAARAQAATAASVYQETLAREAVLRQELDALGPDAEPEPMLSRVRIVVREYEEAWRAFPTSGYSDNALWQGARLAADAFWQFGMREDRQTALRLFEILTSRFRNSSLLAQVPAQVERLERAKPAPPAARSPRNTRAVRQEPLSSGTNAAAGTAVPAPGPSVLKSITRQVLPDALRVTLELERETPFSTERIDGPDRVFVELQHTLAGARVRDARISYRDDVIRQIRVGRPQDSRIRVVFDLNTGAARHSVFTLYNPYRIVVDFERAPAAAQEVRARLAARSPARKPPAAAKAGSARPSAARGAPPPVRPPAAAASSAGAEAVPPDNSEGLSIARQLGLGVARIVIDPGHGGHDPGAMVKDANEADLVLDVALRLEKLLAARPDVDVILTRRTDAFVPLEERTALANREDADLFLSIHANASLNTNARGVETYFLNFATNPEAEAVAARENAGSSKTMSHLPDIVRAIALNNKIDESRDFAAIVQRSLYDRLRKSNKEARNLGVKQAPFMVLIGATMPSILAEISFITNQQEGRLLRTEDYRQEIAEALFAGVMTYQEGLKKSAAIAAQ